MQASVLIESASVIMRGRPQPLSLHRPLNHSLFLGNAWTFQTCMQSTSRLELKHSMIVLGYCNEYAHHVKGPFEYRVTDQTCEKGGCTVPHHSLQPYDTLSA